MGCCKVFIFLDRFQDRVVVQIPVIAFDEQQVIRVVQFRHQFRGLLHLARKQVHRLLITLCGGLERRLILQQVKLNVQTFVLKAIYRKIKILAFLVCIVQQFVQLKINVQVVVQFMDHPVHTFAAGDGEEVEIKMLFRMNI